MWGRATLAMEVSRTSMKAARATVMAMSQGLTRGFQGVSRPGCGLARVVLAGAGAAVVAADKSLLLCGFFSLIGRKVLGRARPGAGADSVGKLTKSSGLVHSSV